MSGEVINAEFTPAGGSTAIARVLTEGDPEQQLMVLEKQAQLAKRHQEAINAIMVSQTFPEDWTFQGKNACLGSAGAERIGRMFDIKHSDVTCHKEEFEDKHGKGYRYIYEGKASLAGTTLEVQGSHSTRDKLLGYANEQWKPLEDINENYIRTAAYHVFCGNAVKALLGIRNIPAAQYREMMRRAGHDPSTTINVERGAGTQGGTSEDDGKKQRELVENCMAIANASFGVWRNEDGSFKVAPDEGEGEPIERAKDICITLSTFKGKDGDLINGLPAKQLKGKRLDVTLGSSRKALDEVNKANV